MSLQHYRSASARIMKIIQSVCLHFQRASIDEAYIDVTDKVNEQIKEFLVANGSTDIPVCWENSESFVVGQREKQSRGLM